jgi:hypothetical protein
MRKTILAATFLLMLTPSFAQTGNNEAVGGGKTTKDKPAATTKATPKKPPAKRTSTAAPVSSPCGVYYSDRADMLGAANATDKWFSIGQSANRHFWYNPHRTNCDAKTGVLKSWIKEEHKNTGGDYALVLYEMKCRSDQLRVKTVIEYDSTGGLLETTNHEDDEPFQDVAPGTAGAVMIRIACRRPQNN